MEVENPSWLRLNGLIHVNPHQSQGFHIVFLATTISVWIPRSFRRMSVIKLVFLYFYPPHIRMTVMSGLA